VPLSPALQQFRAVSGKQELGDLGKFPAFSFYFEDPHDIEAVAGPLLGTRFVVAEEEVSDIDDGAVLPADEHYAGLSLGKLHELLLLALGVAKHGFLAERLGQGFNGVQRTTALDVALGIFGEDDVGYSQCGMRAGVVDRIEKANEGTRALPSSGGKFVFAVGAGEGHASDGIFFVGLFAVADEHDLFGH
jgi:hypothetical protein